MGEASDGALGVTGFDDGTGSGVFKGNPDGVRGSNENGFAHDPASAFDCVVVAPARRKLNGCALLEVCGQSEAKADAGAPPEDLGLVDPFCREGAGCDVADELLLEKPFAGVEDALNNVGATGFPMNSEKGLDAKTIA